MKKEFKVNGMHCKSCEMLIKDILEDEAGVKIADASFDKGNVVIEFDENEITPQKVVELLKKEGYKVE